VNDQPLFGAGHNSRTPRELAEAAIAERLERFVQRVAEIKASAESYQKIRDRVDAGQAADVLGIAKTVLELIDAERKQVAAPYDEAVGAVRSAAERFVADMVTATDALRRRADAWAREEDKRIRDQEAEQQEFERRRRQLQAPAESAPPVSAPPPILAPAARPKRRTIQGDYGASISIGTDYEIAITNWRELPDFVFAAEPVRQAIRGVLMPLVRKKVPIAGTSVSEVAKTTARRA
jgi:hypothetical protein